MFIRYAIILALGFAASYTDIKYKKILNKHLSIAIALGIVSFAGLIASQQILFDINLIWNLIIGIGISLLLYFTETWGGGDAKLFIAFCLIMPTEKYSQILFFPSIAIFVNIFLIGTFAMLILSIKQILQDKIIILKKIFSLRTLIILSKSFLVIFSLQWIIQAIVDQFLPKTTSFLSILFLFLSYRAIRQLIRKLKNNFILFLVLSIGLASRLLIYPLDSNITVFFSTLKRSLVFTFIFYSLSIIFDLNKPDNSADSKETKAIPFAPLMLLGTLLTNTNLLNWVMQLLKIMRK